MKTVPPPPGSPKIYHILHVDRLTSVIADGALVSDSIMMQSGVGTGIGMDGIKARRLRLPVSCHPGRCVGEFVPFYFCPRSIMLFVIHCANHPNLTYRGGQEPIVHLEADLRRTVRWAEDNGREWAFSPSNAGAYYTQFRSNLQDLGDVDWAAVDARNFQPQEVKEGKQAEFLLYDSFPWDLVDRVGVKSQSGSQRVAQAMHGALHRPKIEILPEWYF
jgi:hypothetical protein